MRNLHMRTPMELLATGLSDKSVQCTHLLTAPMPRLPSTTTLKLPVTAKVTIAAPGLGAAVLRGSRLVCTRLLPSYVTHK